MTAIGRKRTFRRDEYTYKLVASDLAAGSIKWSIWGDTSTIEFSGIEELSATSSRDPDIQEDSFSTLEFSWSCEHADTPQTDAATATCVDALALNENLNAPILLIDRSERDIDEHQKVFRESASFIWKKRFEIVIFVPQACVVFEVFVSYL